MMGGCDRFRGDVLVSKFIEVCGGCGGRGGSVYNALRALSFFCSVSGLSPSELVEALPEREELWEKFFMELKRGGVTGITANRYLAGMRTFLAYAKAKRRIDWDYVNELKKRIYGRGLTKNIFAEREGELTRELVREILIHGCKTIRERVMVLVLATSGMSIGDALRLRVGDIQDLDREKDLYMIEYRRKKTGAKAVTFITRETRDMIMKYLDERRKRGHEITAQSPLIANNLEGFVSLQRVYYIFRKIFDRVGLTDPIGKDAKGNTRHKYHIHLFRKFFRTTLRNVGIERIYVEIMMGHDVRSTFGVEMVYDKQVDKPEVLEEQYRKAIPELTFLSELPYLEKRRREAELEDRLKRLERLVNRLLSLQTQHSLQDLEAF